MGSYRHLTLGFRAGTVLENGLRESDQGPLSRRPL